MKIEIVRVYIPRSTFDPRPPCHRKLVEEPVQKLLGRLKQTVPSTGLTQFWKFRATTLNMSDSMLWNHVLFSQEHSTTLNCERLFEPTTQQCYEYLSKAKIDIHVVESIEGATRDQSDNELWHALRNGRLTSSRFGEIKNRKQAEDWSRISWIMAKS